MQIDQRANGGGSSERTEATVATVLRILDEMGISASEDAVLTAPTFYDSPVLLKQSGDFSRFSMQAAVKLRFVGYAFEEVAFLTVRQFSEMYVRDSFPALPTVPLSDGRYELEVGRPGRGLAGAVREFPICFVLGAPRSGTTLFRAMLNVHRRLWAPGELHLANFGTMAERAIHVGPILRYMPIPEVASRCGQSIAEFSRTFRGWELDATPVSDVFQHLQDADSDVMIVDKSPPYSASREVLERIGQKFPNAKFVHLIRSPHDMIRSYVRMQLHRGNRRLFEPNRNPYQMGEAVWRACNANAEEFLAGVPPDRKCTVRYEELTSQPAACLARVCELLGHEFEPAMADPYARSSGPIAAGAGDLHIHLQSAVKNRTPARAFFPIGRRCQNVIDRYGY